MKRWLDRLKDWVVHNLVMAFLLAIIAVILLIALARGLNA